jgi:hypothetical protein
VVLCCRDPADTFTAPIHSAERAGNGVVIGDDGLVLTIGYLIAEGHLVWLSTNRGTVQGHALADRATGFDLDAARAIGRAAARARRAAAAAGRSSSSAGRTRIR